MELDDFKQSLQESIDATTPNQYPTIDVREMHGVRSVSLVDKIRRNFLLELGASVVALLFFGYIAYTTKNTWIRQYLLVVIPVVSLFYVDFFLRFRKIQRLAPKATENLLNHLQSTVDIIDRFCKNYIRFNVCFTLLAVFTSFYFSAYNGVGPETLAHWLTKPLVWGILAGACGVSMWLAYVFTKWWVKLLYGKHAQQLRQSMEQLKEM
ncbi:MAG: hypothetical protein EAY72_09750 [Bacteroidetes bacterium]|nr:MAG: hypothetical protein EAY72_09750 [Bacteroidota bacterium]